MSRFTAPRPNQDRGNDDSTGLPTPSLGSGETAQGEVLLRQLAALFAEQNSQADAEAPPGAIVDENGRIVMGDDDGRPSGLQTLDFGGVLGPLEDSMKARIVALIEELIPAVPAEEIKGKGSPQLPSPIGDIKRPTAITALEVARARTPRGFALWRAVRMGLVAAAAGAVLAVGRHAGVDHERFTARGGATSNAPERGARSRVFVFEVRAGEGPKVAGESLRSGSELAFSYENRSGKRYLAVFGVNEQREVYWFYPEWTKPEENPVAISIETDDHRHELQEAVRHNIEGGRLDIHAVFLDDALSVRQIEALVRANAEEIVIPGAMDDCQRFVLEQ